MPATDLFGDRRRPTSPAWCQGLDSEAVTLPEQVACVRRELALRRRVYRERVAAGRMSPSTARRELAHMTAVLRTLNRIGAAG